MLGLKPYCGQTKLHRFLSLTPADLAKNAWIETQIALTNWFRPYSLFCQTTKADSFSVHNLSKREAEKLKKQLGGAESYGPLKVEINRW